MICGKKCAIYCMITSVWAVIMLTIEGILYLSDNAGDENFVGLQGGEIKDVKAEGVQYLIAAFCYGLCFVGCFFRYRQKRNPLGQNTNPFNTFGK